MEKPTYFDDNYAAKFLAGKTVIPDDQRIFHRTAFTYDDVAALGNARFEEGVVQVDLFFRSGKAGKLVLRMAGSGVVRMQMGQADAEFDETSPMLMPQAEETPAIQFNATQDSYCVQCAGATLELDRYPFCLRMRDGAGAVIFETEWEKIVDQYTAPPLGLRRTADSAAAFFSWRMRNNERVFGLGEKFTRFEKTGTRATIWQADTCGSNTTDMSYKAVPVIFSTAGWAMMLHSSFRSSWEIGSFSYATGSLLVEDDRLDLFFFLAPTLKEQIFAYTALTGRPSMPPRWAFGLWMSRAAYQNRAQMMAVAERLRAERIPCDVFNIDPTWMQKGYYNEIGVEVCNFNWNSRDWGPPAELFHDFTAQGFGICLWINPYLSEDAPLYAEGREKGYLVRDASGSPARLEFGLAAGMVDFTHPDAKAWWQAQLLDLLEQGASVFKVDFGDRVPEDAQFFNGKSGREMHNLYVHLYAQAVFEAVQQAHGTGIIWRRPGYIGTQRYPGCWAGDTQVTWEGMAGALRGGLSAGFTGEAFWSHDIGGFVGQQPTEELYIRWMQFGLLSPFARFHGTTPREPWHYGERAMEVARRYTQMRYTLIPYLLAYGRESTETGMPLLRPLILEFPHEPRIDAIDDQYLLGPDLLIAPVFQAGAETRAVYFPSGTWTAWDASLSAQSGPGFHQVAAPLETIPFYVRAGAVIPRYREAPQHLKGDAPTNWLLDILPGTSKRHLVIDEANFRVQIDYQKEGDWGRLEISPAPVTITVRLVNCRPTFYRALRGTLQPGLSPTLSRDFTFVVEAHQGVLVEFRA